MKKLANFIFALLLFLPAAVYKPLSDQEYVKKADKFIVNDYVVNYTINSYRSDDIANVNFHLINSSKLVFDFLEKKDISFSPCRRAEYIDVFLVKDEVLNDKSKFNGWVGFSETEHISGLFDVHPEVAGRNIILIGDYDKISKVKILSHEVAHYWHYRMCLDIFSDVDTEIFADDFEKFYIKRNMIVGDK